MSTAKENSQKNSGRARGNAKALKLLGISEEDLGAAAGHRKRKSKADGDFDAFRRVSSPSKRLSTPEANRSGRARSTAVYSFAAAGASPSPSPSRAAGSPEGRPKLRGFARKPRSRTLAAAGGAGCAAGGQLFREAVERNLASKGFHTRSRSTSSPIVSFTPGERRRAVGPSVDFNELVGNPNGFNAFMKYLAGEYSDENLRFWRAVEEFRDSPTAGRAAAVHDEFVRQGADSQVNIPCHVRRPIDALAAAWKEADAASRVEGEARSAFDEAQREVVRLMERDSLARFKQSDAIVKYQIDRPVELLATIEGDEEAA